MCPFVRRLSSGIRGVDPHGTSLATARPKFQGLARYVETLFQLPIGLPLSDAKSSASRPTRRLVSDNSQFVHWG